MSFRIALCQINTTPGDVPGNVRKVKAAALRAEEGGADVAVFPELALVGYMPRDLLFRRRFGEAVEAATAELAAASGRTALVVGVVGKNPGRGRPFTNEAAFLAEGRVIGRTGKSLLPSYDVFDEARYFEPAADAEPFEFRGRKIGLVVCEDLWSEPVDVEAPGYARDPAARLRDKGAELLLNLSASPFHLGKEALRERTVADVARRVGLPIALTNLVGASDDVLFDGRSIAVDREGRVVARAKAFEEDVVVYDVDAASSVPQPSFRGDAIDELRAALVLGLRDYARKAGFERAHLGLSGGVDSAVVLALAVEAFGKERVRGFALPSRFSSEGSRVDAFAAARANGVPCDEIAIDPIWTAASSAVDRILGDAPFGTTEENLQSRARGMLLMAVANRTGSLLLTTGNKSELAVGYGTLYGDLCGGFAPISDVLKTDVFRLAERYAAEGLVPRASIEKPPSAELRPNQRDQDSLPPYETLDGILRAHLERDLGVSDLIAEGFDGATARRVVNMVARAEFKRRQAPPGVRVTRKAFGQGRRMPIAASALDWLA